MRAFWDGTTRSETLSEKDRRLRNDLADAAKTYEWSRVISIISADRTLVNTTRPDGSSLYAPLHQAAHGNAPTGVVLELVRLGAWRTLQNAHGERAVDVAERRRHHQLREVLSPEIKRHVPLGVLLKMQSHFHALIHSRTEHLIPVGSLRLPELEPLLEFDDLVVWFRLPGIYGGFLYRLHSAGVDAVLVVESWLQEAEGSGQRYKITSRGTTVVAEDLG